MLIAYFQNLISIFKNIKYIENLSIGFASLAKPQSMLLKFGFVMCWNLSVKLTQLRRTVDYYEKKKIRSVLQGLKKQKSRDDIQRKRSMDWGRQFSTEQLNNMRNSLESVIALQQIQVGSG